MAAARAGISRVMLPARNRKGFRGDPGGGPRQRAICLAERVDEAMAAASQPSAEARRRAAPDGNLMDRLFA